MRSLNIMCWNITWQILKFLLDFFAHLEVEGLENLKGIEGPAIVMANHVSSFDPPSLAVAIPSDSKILPIHFLVKEEVYYYNLLLTKLFKALGSIPINHERPFSIRKALRLLKQDKIVGIFPEGTTSPNGGLMPFKHGIDLLASNGKTIVLPAVIEGTFRSGTGKWQGLKNIINFLLFQYRIKVIFGKPIKNLNIEKQYIEFYNSTR